MKAPVPILRSFDANATKEFYLDYLGFSLLFEYKLAGDAPLYFAVKQGACELHLSEHYGDGTPGTFVRIEVSDVSEICDALHAKTYRHAKPGWQRQEWGWDEMSISDPAGNKLIFCSPVPEDTKKADH